MWQPAVCSQCRLHLADDVCVKRREKSSGALDINVRTDTCFFARIYGLWLPQQPAVQCWGQFTRSCSGKDAQFQDLVTPTGKADIPVIVFQREAHICVGNSSWRLEYIVCTEWAQLRPVARCCSREHWSRRTDPDENANIECWYATWTWRYCKWHIPMWCAFKTNSLDVTNDPHSCPGLHRIRMYDRRVSVGVDVGCYRYVAFSVEYPRVILSLTHRYLMSRCDILVIKKKLYLSQCSILVSKYTVVFMIRSVMRLLLCWSEQLLLTFCNGEDILTSVKS